MIDFAHFSIAIVILWIIALAFGAMTDKPHK